MHVYSICYIIMIKSLSQFWTFQNLVNLDFIFNSPLGSTALGQIRVSDLTE